MPGFAKTELASGVPDLRGVKRVSPEEIAAQTIDALKVPRFDVWAPKRLAGGHHGRRDHAAPTWREAVSRAMNSNRVVDDRPERPRRLRGPRGGERSRRRRDHRGGKVA